jgi:hypothetical protein
MLGQRQLDHRLIGINFVFEETLLILFTAGDLTAKLFNRGNRFEKILSRSIGLIKCKVGLAGYRLRLPKNIENTGLSREGIFQVLSKPVGGRGTLPSERL